MKVSTQKTNTQHHDRDEDHDLAMMPNYGCDENHGQLVIVSTSSYIDDYSCDNDHGPTMKVSRYQNSPFVFGCSDNGHNDNHNPAITRDHDCNHGHDQVMTVSNV